MRKTDIPKKTKTKYDVNKLPSAIVDGQFLSKVNDRILVVKDVDGKKIQCTCLVKIVRGELVETWDETLQRWFSFKLSDNIVAKLL